MFEKKKAVYSAAQLAPKMVPNRAGVSLVVRTGRGDKEKTGAFFPRKADDFPADGHDLGFGRAEPDASPADGDNFSHGFICHFLKTVTTG